MLGENSSRTVVALLAAVSLVCVSCSSPGTKRGGGSALERAIALYIDGEYERAAGALNELVETLESETEVQTAYLYLGRSYMSLGEYVRAAEAFSTGRMLGGGIEFDGHLAAAQQHLRTTPRNIRTQNVLTRAQLAALIENLLVDSRGDRGVVSDDEPGDMKNHWARGYVAAVRAAGIMDAMPDGKFHPDRRVTYAAFYVVAVRTARALGLTGAAVADRFPGGLGGVLRTTRGDSPAAAAGGLISGREASEILQSLVSEAGE